MEGPSSSPARLALAEDHLRNGRFAEAEAVCRAVLGREPGDLEGTCLLARALLQQDRAAEAAGPLKAVVGKGQGEGRDAALLLAEVLLRSGDAAGAFAVLRSLAPGEAGEGRRKSLLTRAELALLSSPEKGRAYLDRARALLAELGWPEPPGLEGAVLGPSGEGAGEVPRASGPDGGNEPDTRTDLAWEELAALCRSPAPPAPGDDDRTVERDRREVLGRFRSSGEAAEATLEIDAADGGGIEEVVAATVAGSPPPSAPPSPSAPGPPVPVPVPAPGGTGAPGNDDPGLTLELDPDVDVDLAMAAPALQVSASGPRGGAGGAESPGEPTMDLDPEAEGMAVPLAPPPAGGGSAAPGAASPPPAAGAGVVPKGPPTPTPLPRFRGADRFASATPSPSRFPRLVVFCLLAAVAAGIALAAGLTHRRVAVSRREERRVRAVALLDVGTFAAYLEARSILAPDLPDAAENPEVGAVAGLLAAALADEHAAEGEDAARIFLARAGTDPRLAPLVCPGRVHLLLLAGEAVGAVRAARECLSAGMGGARLEGLLGRALALAGDLEGAARHLDAAARRAPAFAPVATARVDVALRRGRTDEAVAAALALETALPASFEAHLERARVLLFSGEIDGAGRLLRDAGTANPISPAQRVDLLLLHHRLALRQGNAAGAAAFLAQAAAAAPPRDARHLVAVAEAALDAGYTGRARDLLDRAAGLGTLEERVQFLLGRLGLEDGEPRKALDALAAAGNSPDTACLRGRAHAALGRLAEARATVERYGEVPCARVLLEELAYREGREEEAWNHLLDLAGSRGWPEAWLSLGRLSLERGDVDGAVRTLGEAVRLDPLRGTPRALLGEALLAGGRAEAARRSFEEALRLAPGLQSARVGLGRALLAGGDARAARRVLEEVLAAGGHGEAFLARAEIALAEGDADGARENLQRAATLGAERVRLARLRAALALKEGRSGEAVEVLDREVRTAPARRDLRVSLADALLQDGQVERSRGVVGRLLGEDHGDPLALVLLGRILLRQGREDGALEVLQRAVARAKERGLGARERAEALVALAEAHHACGEYGAALVVLDDAQELDPRNAGAFLVRGRVLDTLDRPLRARKAYEQALSLDGKLALAHFYLGMNLSKEPREADRASSHLRRYLALALTGEKRAEAVRTIATLAGR